VTALYIVGDVFAKVAELRRRRIRVALVLCSPPFLALRSYLPDGHPLKGSEIGSEATTAAFIDVMLALVAELAHVLEPWGSIAFELGDTYAGSGGAGGDYDPDGLRAGQNAFDGSAARTRADGNGKVFRGGRRGEDKQGNGWPLDKSLAGIPEAFMLSLAYGYNVLDRRGPDSPAGRWRVRNFKPWIRSNPPVGALGDKERPATSYITVATRDAQRYFDLDAVRTASANDRYQPTNGAKNAADDRGDGKGREGAHFNERTTNAAGAPPRDWWHHVDGVLDACLDDMASKTVSHGPRGDGGAKRLHTNQGGEIGPYEPVTAGARGVHLRRALERAGILSTVDALDVSPKGYKGAHYAVWPPELVRLLIEEMCPRRVCATCGQPSRRIVGEATYVPSSNGTTSASRPAGAADEWDSGVAQGKGAHSNKRDGGMVRSAPTLGWSDCGCPGEDRWRPGLVLDPFVGSGTTLQVCSGLGRDSIGIDLDYTNVGLAMERVGMWLDVEWPEPDLELLRTRALGPGSPHPADYQRWARLTGDVWHVWGSDDEPEARSVHLAGDEAPLPSAKPPKRRAVPVSAGQSALF
jgi:hypothetical protein